MRFRPSLRAFVRSAADDGTAKLRVFRINRGQRIFDAVLIVLVWAKKL